MGTIVHSAADARTGISVAAVELWAGRTGIDILIAPPGRCWFIPEARSSACSQSALLQPAVGGALASPRPAPCQKRRSSLTRVCSPTSRRAGASTAPAKPWAGSTPTRYRRRKLRTRSHRWVARIASAGAGGHDQAVTRLVGGVHFGNESPRSRMVIRVALFPPAFDERPRSDWNVAQRSKVIRPPPRTRVFPRIC